jgi:hypothetical protein
MKQMLGMTVQGFIHKLMKPKTYFTISGTIFAIVFVLHLLRVINAWPAQISNFVVPLWLSWIAFILAGYLAWEALFKLK